MNELLNVVLNLSLKIISGIINTCGISYLSYLEIHITDHCNLNCKGCSHFSPIADEKYADIKKFSRDVDVLSQSIKYIRLIRLLGGEPLLNPEIELFLESTRKNYPQSRIRVVTNGILLPKMKDSFWDSCRINNIGIDITIYPPFKNKERLWVEYCRKNRISVNVLKTKGQFSIKNDLTGRANQYSVFRKCSLRYCTTLQGGKIYLCPFSAHNHHLNSFFDLNIPNPYVFDIYSSRISGAEILKRLNTPISSCAYCTNQIVYFNWAFSNRELSEWDASDELNCFKK